METSTAPSSPAVVAATKPSNSRSQTQAASTSTFATSSTSVAAAKPASAPAANAPPTFPNIKFTTLNQDVLLYRPEVDAYDSTSGGPSASVGESSKASGKRDGDDSVPPPKVILIFGFMSAATKSLGRWTGTYAQMYPRATIALIKMRPKYFFISEQEQERTIRPIYDLLMSEVYNPELAKREKAEKRGLLVHMLSNGGSFQFAVLARMLARRFSSASVSTVPTPAPAFPYFQVHDSVPGPSSLSSVSAFTVPLASLPLPTPLISLLRIVAWPPAALVVGSTLAVYWVTGRSGGMDVAERVDGGGIGGGGSGRAFGGMRRWVRIGLPVGVEHDSEHGDEDEDRRNKGIDTTTRLYIYSNTDEQVPSRGVESHIAEVLSSIKPSSSTQPPSTPPPPPRPTTFLPNSSSTPHPLVRVEKFSGTRHVGHAKADPERYWGAVSEMWGVAVGEVMRGGARL